MEEGDPVGEGRLRISGLSGTRGEACAPAGLAGGMDIPAEAVADVEEVRRLHGKGIGNVPEGTGVGLVEADFGGDEDGFEAIVKVVAAEKIAEAAVVVGKDDEAEAGFFEGGEGFGEIGGNPPGVGLSEGMVGGLEGGLPRRGVKGEVPEDLKDNGAPESRTEERELGGIPSEGVFKGVGEGAVEDEWVELDSVGGKGAGVDVADGGMGEEKGSPGIEGEHLGGHQRISWFS